VIVLGASLFEYYDRQQEKGAELNFLAFEGEWSWLDHKQFIQVSKYNRGTRTRLRRVVLDKGRAVYVRMGDDYTYATTVLFEETCPPLAVISTTKQFSDGTYKTLTCSANGDYLSHSAVWNIPDLTLNWKEDLDGYSWNEYFRSWNFDVLKRERTLAKAI